MSTKANIFKNVVRVTIYFLLVFFMFFIGSKSFGFGKALFTDAGKDKAPGVDVPITILSGMSNGDVAEELERAGVIESKLVFEVQSILYKADFKKGVYTVNTSTSPEDLIEVLSAGENNHDSE